MASLSAAELYDYIMQMDITDMLEQEKLRKRLALQEKVANQLPLAMRDIVRFMFMPKDNYTVWATYKHSLPQYVQDSVEYLQFHPGETLDEFIDRCLQTFQFGVKDIVQTYARAVQLDPESDPHDSGVANQIYSRFIMRMWRINKYRKANRKPKPAKEYVELYEVILA